MSEICSIDLRSNQHAFHSTEKVNAKRKLQFKRSSRYHSTPRENILQAKISILKDNFKRSSESKNVVWPQRKHSSPQQYWSAFRFTIMRHFCFLLVRLLEDSAKRAYNKKKRKYENDRPRSRWMNKLSGRKYFFLSNDGSWKSHVVSILRNFESECLNPEKSWLESKEPFADGSGKWFTCHWKT